MRIENNFAPFLFQSEPPPMLRITPLENSSVSAPLPANRIGPAYVVDISPGAQAAAQQAAAQAVEGGSSDSIAALTEPKECQTCKNRKYQDGSDDPSVSFQSPTRIGPGEAASAVAAHESEHVAHEQAKAEKEGRRIVSQTVTLQTSVCPECGRIYVSGGVTRTVTASDNKGEQNAQPGGVDLYA